MMDLLSGLTEARKVRIKKKKEKEKEKGEMQKQSETTNSLLVRALIASFRCR